MSECDETGGSIADDLRAAQQANARYAAENERLRAVVEGARHAIESVLSDEQNDLRPPASIILRTVVRHLEALDAPWLECADHRRADGGSCCPTCTHEADAAPEDDDD